MSAMGGKQTFVCAKSLLLAEKALQLQSVAQQHSCASSDPDEENRPTGKHE